MGTMLGGPMSAGLGAAALRTPRRGQAALPDAPALREVVRAPAPPERLGTPPRIVFVIMSAVACPQTVDQLAQALAPHPVLVHHDFSQSPHFALRSPQVRFVPRPVRTGWGQFGFVEGIFHALEHALAELDFDYLQLLSPSCLPIQPMQAFERHVSGPQEAHFEGLDLRQDLDALLSVGYRAWTAEGSPMHRLMRRLVTVCFDRSPGRRDVAGVWLRTGVGEGLGSQLARLTLQALPHPLLGRHPRGQPLRLYYGSTWFGARRHIVAGLVQGWKAPGLRKHFSRVRLAEEFLIPTLLMQLQPRHGPLNHRIQRFEGAHPGCFGVEHLELLRGSGAYFARKFPDDPDATVRLRVLQELAQTPAQTVAL